MKKTLTMVVCILLLASSSVILTLGGTITVCDSTCQFKSIQQAVNKAESGDQIKIKGGVYRNNLTINKNLTLIGVETDKVKIHGTKEDRPGLLIGPEDNNVIIKNIAFKNSEGGCDNYKKGICAAGISVFGHASVDIVDCEFEENGGGVRLMGSASARISDSIFSKNVEYGINLWGSSRASVINCDILGVEDTFVSGGYGIMVNDSSHLEAKKCEISSHFNGLDVENTATSIVEECKILYSENGITLRNSAQFEINNSSIAMNKVGIWTSNAMTEGSFDGQITGQGNIFYGNEDTVKGLSEYNFLRN